MYVYIYVFQWKLKYKYITFCLSLNLKFKPSVFAGRCQSSQYLELRPMTLSSPRLPASVATICPWLQCLRQLVEQHPRA